MSDATPIRYESAVQVRFSDLDSYNLVNSKHHIDLVVTSRWIFMKRRFGVTDRTLFERGLVFYLSRFEIEFKRPIDGIQDVMVASHVAEVRGPRLEIPFVVASPERDLRFAEGRMKVVSIDVQSRQPIPLPDWMRPYLFETGRAASD